MTDRRRLQYFLAVARERTFTPRRRAIPCHTWLPHVVPRVTTNETGDDCDGSHDPRPPAGESEERLYMLNAWRESPLYSDRERAALELCEAMTEIAVRGVPDDVWARAAAAFSDEELAQVVLAITVINAWNRLQITTKVEPGHYQPGMFDSPASVGDGR